MMDVAHFLFGVSQERSFFPSAWFSRRREATRADVLGWRQELNRIAFRS